MSIACYSLYSPLSTGDLANEVITGAWRQSICYIDFSHSGTSQLPARIDLSRPQGVERAPTMDTENNSLFVSRDNTFVTPRTRDHANTAPVSASAANLSSDAKLKQPSAPRGKEVGSSKNKAHITTGTVAEINSPKKQTEESWQPLSLPALSGYLPVGTGRVSGDGINYIKTQH